MKTVDMYEIDEEVMIKAKVTNITVEDGELKYSLKTEFANNDIGHLFTGDEIIGPMFKEEAQKGGKIAQQHVDNLGTPTPLS